MPNISIPPVVGAEALFGAARILSNALHLNLPKPAYAILDSATRLPILVPDQFLTLSFERNFDVVDYPVEPNRFATYNKVYRPATLELNVVVSGTDIARYTFLQTLQLREFGTWTTAYALVTPEALYDNYTLAGWRYARQPGQNVNRLSLILTFREVSPDAQFLAASASPLNSWDQVIANIGQTTVSAWPIAATSAVSSVLGF